MGDKERRSVTRRILLTGDGWLRLRDARKLARWWHGNGWSASVHELGRRRFAVTAVKVL